MHDEWVASCCCWGGDWTLLADHSYSSFVVITSRITTSFLPEKVYLEGGLDGMYTDSTPIKVQMFHLSPPSHGRVQRCLYTSTSLYEYRGWNSKPANHTHRLLTWGLRSSERHVVDFYISDFHTGLRALVKTGPFMPMNLWLSM
ncbi:unnamed protein product [Rhodiola kirilowii]